jgi:hypothetical protein
MKITDAEIVQPLTDVQSVPPLVNAKPAKKDTTWLSHQKTLKIPQANVFLVILDVSAITLITLAEPALITLII